MTTLRHDRTHTSWRKMKERCFNPNSAKWKYYGGRGITVCARWRDSFASFLLDMGERPLGMTLDRIDNNGNYEPGNCRWATQLEQVRNRRDTIMVDVAGRVLPLKSACDELGVTFAQVWWRMQAGVPAADALALAHASNSFSAGRA